MPLRVNYKNDLFDGSRKYRMTTNTDGTISLEDVTEYTQQGDNFGADDINTTNTAVNNLQEDFENSQEGTGWQNCILKNGIKGALKIKKVGEMLMLKGTINNLTTTTGGTSTSQLGGKAIADIPESINVAEFSVAPVNCTPEGQSQRIARFDYDETNGLRFISSTRSTIYATTNFTFNNILIADV